MPSKPIRLNSGVPARLRGTPLFEFHDPRARPVTAMARTRTKRSATHRMRWHTAVCGGALTLAVVLVDLLGGLAPAERWAYDKRAAWCQMFTPPPTPQLVHVDIDDPTLAAIGAWPWPRSEVADILDELRLAGPRAVALDVLFLEPQRLEWVERSGGRFEQVDHDARLAEAFAKLGNVILPASLRDEPPPPESPAHAAVRAALTADLEATPETVRASLAARGLNVTADALDGLIVAARKEAARARVDETVAKHRSGGATTRPATSASTAPGTRPTSGPASDFPDLETVRRALLPKSDPALRSPLSRAVEEAYEQARAVRALSRLGYDLPPAVPHLRPSPAALLPVAALADAAAATAFVDYPTFGEMGDGKVRSVPLFVEYRGRIYPQMGVMVAAMALGVSPNDFTVSRRSITIPAGARGGAPRVVPVRTGRHDRTGDAMPLTFDIPWFGPPQWERMYPTSQRVSLSKIHEAVRTRRKIIANNAAADAAFVALLGFVDGWNGTQKLKAFQASPLPIGDPNARLALARTTLDEVKALGLEDAAPTTGPAAGTPARPMTEQDRMMFAALKALRDVIDQNPPLGQQLQDQRAALASTLGGKALLVGWTATAVVADTKPTPIHPIAPGVLAHGAIVNAILTGQAWRTLPHWVTLLTTLALGLAMTAGVSRLSADRASYLAVALVPAYLLFNGLVLFDWGDVVLGVAGPVAAVWLVWAGGTLTRLISEQRERARLTRRMGSYVDPDLLDYVQENQEEVFTPQAREMTVVFTDLEGFTSMSNRLGPGIIPLLNRFMGLATEVIKQHNGFVNKFLGDGVMFFYNAPKPNLEYARDAIATVLDLQAMVKRFNEELASQGLPKLSNRAGVTTGSMVVGDAGDGLRHDYTVLGDLVNLAARLESANKAMGTSNLLSDATIDHLGGQENGPFLVRPVGRIVVVGLPEGIMTYEALARRDDATQHQRKLAEMTREVVDSFLDARPADCLEAVARMEEAFGESKLTRAYREQCRQFLEDPDAGEFVRQIVLTSK